MAPAQFPRCSGTRNLHDNLSDLRAQVAANQKVCYSLLYFTLFCICIVLVVISCCCASTKVLYTARHVEAVYMQL